MNGLSRRGFGAAAAAALLAPTFARAAQVPLPSVIAEGGAASERPEDTRLAFELAIDQGADFLQAGLVPTKDGILIVRRDNELSASTDIAAHPEFAGRRAAKTVDGGAVTGWFAEDFTLAELKTLMCRERRPALRPQNTRYDGKQPILTLAEVLAIARDGCVRTLRTIGVMPRLLRAGYFAGLDLVMPSLLASELNSEGYDSPAAAIWAQADDPQALKDLAQLTRVRRMLVIEPAGAGTDPAALTGMLTVQGLGDIHGYAQAIAPDLSLVLDPNGALFPTPTTLVLDAHAVGLAVFPRTAQAENAFLPKLLQKGDPKSADFPAGRGDVDKLLKALFADQADGVATTLPARAVRARKSVMDAAQKGG